MMCDEDSKYEQRRREARQYQQNEGHLEPDAPEDNAVLLLVDQSGNVTVLQDHNGHSVRFADYNSAYDYAKDKGLRNVCPVDLEVVL